MSIAPAISLVAYESRRKQLVFVKVPDERGRYVLTSRSVVEVACSHCHVVVGEPCRTKQGYAVTVHYARDNAWRNKRRSHWIDGAPPDQLPAKLHVKLQLTRSID